MKIDGFKLNHIVSAQALIDATPDGGYALRILRQYRLDCDAQWTDNTTGEPPTHLLLVAMNKMQCKRATELDRAIAILEKGK